MPINVRDLEVRVWVYNLVPLAGRWTIGHATYGRIGAAYGNALATSAESDGIADITCDVLAIDISTCSKRRTLDSYEAGRCTLTMDQTDRRYDPFSTSGTTYSPATTGVAANLFARGKRVRVVLVNPATPTVAEFYVWSGYVDTIDTQPPAVGSLQGVTVQCTDAFNYLGQVNQEATTEQGEGETLRDRIVRICHRAGWCDSDGTAASGLIRSYGLHPTSGDGVAPLQATTLAQPALTDLKTAVEAEGGQLWVNRAGQLQWTDRTALSPYPYVTPAWQARDDDVSSPSPVISPLTAYNFNPASVGSFLYEDYSISHNSDELVSYASAYRVGGTAQSVGEPGGPTWTRTNLICQSADDVWPIVNRVLLTHQAVTSRIVGLRVKPWTSDYAMYFVAAAEPGDQIRFVNANQGLNRIGVVLGLQHRITPNQQGGWETTVTTSEGGM